MKSTVVDESLSSIIHSSVPEKINFYNKWQNNPIFSCSQKCVLHKMAEKEKKEAVEFPVIGHFVAGEFM